MPKSKSKVTTYRGKKYREKVITSAVRKELIRKGIANPEQKYYDELANTAILQNDGIFANHSNLLNSIVQGDSVNQRDGFQIQPIKLELRGIITNQSNNVGVVRLMVIRWDDAALPTMNTIFDNFTSASEAPNALFYREGRSKWKLLYDKTFTITNSFEHPRGQVPVEINLSLKRHKPVKFTDGTGNSTAFEKGRYYFIYMSNRNSTAGPTMEYTNRFVYTDN